MDHSRKHTALAALPNDTEPLPAQVFITAIDVETDAPAEAIAVIGDSRVAGAGSTPGTDRRWTDLLAERLIERGGTIRYVVNQGISGNRMLADGIGPAALARFDRDILATPGLGHVIIAVGNDLVFSHAPVTEETEEFLSLFPGNPVTAADVVAAHQQLAQRAHTAGIKAYAATIAPYGGSEMYSPDGNQARERVNDWI